MIKNKLDTLVDIAYFAKCKKTALQHMSKFIRPLNDEQGALMNIFYNAYFTYWLGLVDYLLSKDAMLATKDDIVKLVGSEDNYYYIRNLRNSVIHRAEDFANKGTVIENTNIVVPLSPVDIKDQSERKIYQPFYSNLIDIIGVCEKINSLCLSLIEKNKLTNYADFTKEEFIDMQKSIPYLPVYCKTDEICNWSWEYYYTNKNELRRENIKKILSYFETEIPLQNII